MKKQKRYIKKLEITPVRHKIISGSIKHQQRKGLAELLKMNENTLGTHFKLIYAKLQIHCIAELIMVAIKNGYNSSGKYIKLALLALQLSGNLPFDFVFEDL